MIVPSTQFDDIGLVAKDVHLKVLSFTSYSQLELHSYAMANQTWRIHEQNQRKVEQRTLTYGEVSLYGLPPVWLVWLQPNK